MTERWLTESWLCWRFGTRPQWTEPVPERTINLLWTTKCGCSHNHVLLSFSILLHRYLCKPHRHCIHEIPWPWFRPVHPPTESGGRRIQDNVVERRNDTILEDPPCIIHPRPQNTTTSIDFDLPGPSPVEFQYDWQFWSPWIQWHCISYRTCW